MITAIFAILLHLFTAGGAQPNSTHGGIFATRATPDSTHGGIFVTRAKPNSTYGGIF